MPCVSSDLASSNLLSFGATILTHLLPHCPFLPLFPYMLGLQFIALTRISIVSLLNRMWNFNGHHFFHTRLFSYCSNAWFSKYCGKRALHSLEKSWEVTQHRVPSCGRHLGKLDDVTIYPVLVVARTANCIMPWFPYFTNDYIEIPSQVRHLLHDSHKVYWKNLLSLTI